MKKTTHITVIAILALLPLFLTGCGSRTQIISSWASQGQIPEIKTVLIMALSENDTSRRLWEKSFAEQLAAVNIKTVASYTISEKVTAPEKEAVLRIIEQAQADSVIITHLIDSRTTTHWHPGTIHYAPTAFYGGMYRYYNTAYRAVYSPPTSTEQTVVRLESNLYDAATAELIWAAQSSTTNPKLLRTDFDAVVRTLINNLKENNIFR